MENTTVKNNEPKTNVEVSCNTWKKILFGIQQKENKQHQTGAQINILNFAYENESSLDYDARNLHNDIEIAIRRLEKAKRDLEKGDVDCINSCGILQSLSTDIDMGVTKVKQGIKNRQAYKHFQK